MEIGIRHSSSRQPIIRPTDVLTFFPTFDARGRFHQYHCAIGDPSGAAAEKGRKYLDLVCGLISQFLIELAQAPLDEHFPHVPWAAAPPRNRSGT